MAIPPLRPAHNAAPPNPPPKLLHRAKPISQAAPGLKNRALWG